MARQMMKTKGNVGKKLGRDRRKKNREEKNVKKPKNKDVSVAHS